MEAFVFPGQGSQAVGMGKALAASFAAARDTFAEVDDALSAKLSALMFDGPAEALLLTENAQPAIMACSMAVLRVLEREGRFALPSHARFVAGHSLGEYSALCAAGVFSLADTARLLRARGAAMQAATPVGQGGMAALLGVTVEQAQTIAAEAARSDFVKEVCEVANDNAEGQVVISGHLAAIDHALEIAAAQGFKRSVKLQVSAPFHCRLMQPAADAMQQKLAEVAMQAPCVPVCANVTAQAVMDVTEIRALLVQQITGTVRWRESVLNMRDAGATGLVELGHGNVLTGLAKRIDRALPARAIQSAEDIEAFLKAGASHAAA